MNIEDEIFLKHTIDKDKLISYGFKSKNGKLVFEKMFMDDDFRAEVSFDGKISGKVFDTATNDEYTNFRIEDSIGFSSQIREEFTNLLTDIRDNCTEKQLFKTKQASEINEYIAEKYGDLPEFLWKNFPTYAIYRKKSSKKWYGLIGDVQRCKVDKSSSSTEIVEILNVKADKNKIGEILTINGIYEAYHMNKKYWVTIIFDDTVPQKTIQKLVDESYENV